MDKPIFKKVRGQKYPDFICDKCGNSLEINPDDTMPPLWATYTCDCGVWTQFGAWNGAENLWDYKPTERIRDNYMDLLALCDRVEKLENILPEEPQQPHCPKCGYFTKITWIYIKDQLTKPLNK